MGEESIAYQKEVEHFFEETGGDTFAHERLVVTYECTYFDESRWRSGRLHVTTTQLHFVTASSGTGGTGTCRSIALGTVRDVRRLAVRLVFPSVCVEMLSGDEHWFSSLASTTQRDSLANIVSLLAASVRSGAVDAYARLQHHDHGSDLLEAPSASSPELARLLDSMMATASETQLELASQGESLRRSARITDRTRANAAVGSSILSLMESWMPWRWWTDGRRVGSELLEAERTRCAGQPTVSCEQSFPMLVAQPNAHDDESSTRPATASFVRDSSWAQCELLIGTHSARLRWLDSDSAPTTIYQLRTLTISRSHTHLVLTMRPRDMTLADVERENALQSSIGSVDEPSARECPVELHMLTPCPLVCANALRRAAIASGSHVRTSVAKSLHAHRLMSDSTDANTASSSTAFTDRDYDALRVSTRSLGTAARSMGAHLDDQLAVLDHIGMRVASLDDTLARDTRRMDKL